jgi:Zn-dependent peptidase ImmA (M78 family)/DNA-binding XRE family transcriptional regulator
MQVMERDLFGEQAPSFHKERIKQARELEGLTQEELAALVNVRQAWIAKLESGRKAPSSELMASIAHHTKQPLGFFAQASFSQLGDGTLLFRAKAGISRKKEIEARRHAELVYELAQRLAEPFKPIPVAVQPLNEKPLVAAQIVRKQLGLDAVSPVPHLVRIVEKGGVIVLGIPKFEDRYAFAIWAGREGEVPVIAITEGTSADRQRLSVAHELGHLVLHKNVSVPNKIVEKEAYAFGAEFLAPENGIRKELMLERITLERLGELKLRWGMSIQALVRRSLALGVINERQHRYLVQQIGMRGWKMQEPARFDISSEKPRLLRQLAERAYGEPINLAAIASEAHLSVESVKAILSRYASAADTQPLALPKNVVRFPSAAIR